MHPVAMTAAAAKTAKIVLFISRTIKREKRGASSKFRETFPAAAMKAGGQNSRKRMRMSETGTTR
jgi:hypothetical protein